MKRNKIVSRLSLRAKFTDGGASVQVVIIDGKTNAIQIEQIPLNFSTEVNESEDNSVLNNSEVVEEISDDSDPEMTEDDATKEEEVEDNGD